MDGTVEPADLDPIMAVAVNRDRISRYLLSVTRSPDIADDLTQETMLRALRAAATLREPAALLSWLYRLATNVFLDKVRADRRQPSAFCHLGDAAGADPTDDVPDAGPRPDRLAEQAEMTACVRNYVNELPDGYRAVVLLHDAYGLTDREVADALGLSLAAAKIRIHRARARLRAALQEGCRFETDDRGVLVCDALPDRPYCGPDCTSCPPAPVTAPAGNPKASQPRRHVGR
jgi:RNA polymerase sigma-70 factor (ECF subfamily)